MPPTFQPPANLKDFNRSGNSADLFQAWHDFINNEVQARLALRPAFYNPLHPPSPTPPAFAAPQWTGLPRTIKRLLPGSLSQASAAVENAIPMGNPDPMEGSQFTSRFRDSTGAVFTGPAYRPQDEYLEWVTRRDTDGTVLEVLFTCEGPEYWDNIALDHALLRDMYRELAGDNSVQIDDLIFPKKVSWRNPNLADPGIQTFEVGDYNPYNKWNIKAAVHLTQPANTLAAEITLAKDASRLYGSPTPITTDPDLICCAAYGGINRMSDPTIGLAVNTQVQIGKRVSLRNPIGLYMVAIDQTKFTLPDNTPFTHVKDCFEVLRPAPQDVTDMIVRARFRVPAGLTHNGVQLRVGDLKVNGEKITFGGQVADIITMTLFAQAIPGAPAQQPEPCVLRPCHDPNKPEFIVPIPFSMQCPNGGISPLVANIGLAQAAHTATAAASAAAADRPAPAAQRRPKARHATSRVRGGGE